MTSDQRMSRRRHQFMLAVAVLLTGTAVARRDWVGAGMAGGLTVLVLGRFVPWIESSRAGMIAGTIISLGVAGLAVSSILR